MFLTSFEFIVFSGVLLVVYYIVPLKAQWVVILIFSLLFYMTYGVFGLSYTLLCIVLTYIASRLLSRDYPKKIKRGVLVCTLSVIFSLLFFFKVTPNNGILPLGISFYTFTLAGYLTDIYRSRALAEKNIFKHALLALYFPSLVQGPISRYKELSGELFSPHRPCFENISVGLLRVSVGFFKKLAVADMVGIAVGNIIKEQRSGAYVLFLIVAYSVQIYFDFTGGMDIVIGLSRMLGVGLEENFNSPFTSKNIKEYWRRWHITLGRWFADYVFLPISISRPMQKLSKFSRKKLGTERGKKVPVFLSVMITWFLTGLWHGAGANFIVWGLLNGSLILLSQELQPVYSRFNGIFPKIRGNRFWEFFCRVRTFFIIGSVRILDCYRDVGRAAVEFLSIFYDFDSWGEFFRTGVLSLGLDAKHISALLIFVLAVCALNEIQHVRNISLYEKISKNPLLTFACIGVLCLLTVIFGAYGMGFTASKFIYNEF